MTRVAAQHPFRCTGSPGTPVRPAVELVRPVRLAGRYGSGAGAPIADLTQREAEVLRWIKEGKTNIDIAQILNLSPWTVKNHMQAILKKLSVQNRSHAVARAISLGILSASE